MSQRDKETVLAFIEATEDLDIDGVAELIADDIVVHIPGNNPISGVYRGRDEVLAYYGSLIERTRAAGGGIEVDMHDILASDDHVVTLSRRTFAGADARAAVVYHVDDGKITEAWVHEADQAAVDEALNASLGD